MLLRVALALAALAGVAPALEILSPPAASPAPSPVGTEVSFDAAATGDGVEYAWDFGDGSGVRAFATEAKASHRYARPGRFTVVARIRDASAQKTFTFFVLAHPPLAERRPSSSTPILADAARGRVWVVNPDHGTVACLDSRSLVRLFEVPVGAGPRSLALAPDGTVWVANQDAATVSILNPSDGSPVAQIKLPFASRPGGILFAPDGSAAYVSLEAVGKVLKVDPSSRTVKDTAVIGGRPRALAMPDKGLLLTADFFAGPEDRWENQVTMVDPPSMATAQRARILEDLTEDAENQGSGSFNHLAAIALSPDGSTAWVPAKKDNIRRGLKRNGKALTFENTVRAALFRLTVGKDGKFLESPELRLDFDDSEGPSAVAFGPFGFPAFVAFQGSDKVIAWDPWGESRVMALAAVGAAPRGLAVDSATGRLFVQAYLDRAVSVYDIGALMAGRGTEAPLLKVISTASSEPLSETVLKGKRIFNLAADPRMSKDGYLSCATCHWDGGEDGRVWDFTDRGEGFRNTQSLLGRAGTRYGPLHWSANFDEIQDFEHDIRGPFGGKGFLAEEEFTKEGRDAPLSGPKAGLSPELDALAAYVASLDKTPASPWRAQDGSMTADALEGKALFNSAAVGCAKCHSGPDFTDSRIPGGVKPVAGNPGDTVTPEGFLLHDVGTLTASSGSRLGIPLRGMDTPGLKGVWFSPPYLHDGSAFALEDLVFRTKDGKHGNTSGLDDAGRSKLVAYLKQLDDLDEKGNGSGIRSTVPMVRGWNLSAAPLAAGGWKVEANGFPAGPLDLGVLDPLGRTLGATRLGTAGKDGSRTWIWQGLPGSSQGRVLLLRACAGKDCLGKRLGPGP